MYPNIVKPFKTAHYSKKLDILGGVAEIKISEEPAKRNGQLCHTTHLTFTVGKDKLVIADYWGWDNHGLVKFTTLAKHPEKVDETLDGLINDLMASYLFETAQELETLQRQCDC